MCVLQTMQRAVGMCVAVHCRQGKAVLAVLLCGWQEGILSCVAAVLAG